MEYILAFLLFGLAIIMWRTNGRDQYNLLAILQTALALFVFWSLGQDLSSSNGLILFGILSGTLVAHFIVSRFWKTKGIYWPPLFVVVFSGIFFLFKDQLFVFADFPVDLTQLPVILLPLMGALIEPIADLKEKYLGNFFQIDFKNRRGISRAVYVFLFGFFLFLGHFTASYIGMALVATGFGASLLYYKKSGALWNMYLGLLALIAMGHMSQIGQTDTSNLLLGRVIEGVLFGAFVSLLINTLGRARKNQLIATALSWFLMLNVPVFVILIGTQNVNFGGTDAFLGLLVGFALSAFLGINTRKNSSLLAVYLALGVVLSPMLINEEAEAMTTIAMPETTENPNEKPKDIFEAAGKPMDLTGQFQIDTENTQLTFELGPKGGRTKGAFKSFTGTFELGEQNRISVVLPVDQLSTFNSYRDESLMGDTYFNEAKFPEMTYTTTQIVAKGDAYLAKGNFTMMGVTNSLDVELKYLGKTGKNNAPVFIGRSKLDRTTFGMKSDPTEGNVVDFLFKVELK